MSVASSSVVESVENPKRFTSEQGIGNKSGSGMSSTQRQRSKVSKKVKKADVDSAFLQTINSFGKSFNSRVNALTSSANDEDSLFCKILVGQIKRLQPELKGLAKCQILQLLHNLKFGLHSSQAVNVPFSQQPNYQEYGQQLFLSRQQDASVDFTSYQKM